MPKYHEPVLKEKVFEYLIKTEEGIIVDGTLGDGGHTEFILRHTPPSLKILGIDRDQTAIERAKKRLAPFKDRVLFSWANYSQIRNVLKKHKITKIDGLLLDLGISSTQLEDASRGFSFSRNGPLDMRMDQSEETTVADLLNTLSDKELETIIKEYGEEKNYKRIVRAIRDAQGIQASLTTRHLANAISAALSSRKRRVTIHPGTRTFMALRIALNRELIHLKSALSNSLEVLGAGARMVIISFHSLEDRIVKTFFQEKAKGCICPPEIPVCVCGIKPSLRILTKKPVVPDKEEIRRNPRSSSAKLRAAERIYV